VIDDQNCRNRTIVEVLLALGIIDVVQGALIALSILVTFVTCQRPTTILSNLDRTCTCFRTMAGLSVFVLAIVLSVFVWGSRCNLNKGGIYYAINPYLIAYWSVVVTCTVLSVVGTCCAVCCGTALVALFGNKAL
jgi:hypothetical protein